MRNVGFLVSILFFPLDLVFRSLSSSVVIRQGLARAVLFCQVRNLSAGRYAMVLTSAMLLEAKTRYLRLLVGLVSFRFFVSSNMTGS